MPDQNAPPSKLTALDVSSMEADVAFFDARLSLAGRQPDTVYRKAQIKTYATLGRLLGDTLQQLRKDRGDAPAE